jgi:hypothetical protein
VPETGTELRPSKRRLIALAALWTIVMGAVSFVGCYGHTCDGDIILFGRNPGEGHLIDADTWVTGPIDGRWLDFPHQRAYFLEMKDLGNRTPYEVQAYVSAQADPSHDEGGNFTIAAGNLTEVFQPSPGKVNVKNDTCADYFLYVVVRAPPRAPSGASPTTPATDAGADAGTDAEAGP